MNVIDLQSKACPVAGRIEHYWFENAHTGLRVFLRSAHHRAQNEPHPSALETRAQGAHAMNSERPNAYEQLSPEAAARVDAVCDGFEKAWRAARSGAEMPQLANFLNGCDENERTILAEELQVLDQACRERYGNAGPPGDAKDLV